MAPEMHAAERLLGSSALHGQSRMMRSRRIDGGQSYMLYRQAAEHWHAEAGRQEIQEQKACTGK